MSSYILSPFVSFIESHLNPSASQYAVFHRLTGQIVEPGAVVLELLQAVKLGKIFLFNYEDLDRLGENGRPLRMLIDREFLVSTDHDPLASFVDHYLTRPLQNPAVVYRNEKGESVLVSISMAERVFSPEKLPPILEEILPSLVSELFLAADGSRTLTEVHRMLRPDYKSLPADQEFIDAVCFLTAPERQLIKLAPPNEPLNDPFQPFNTVPRNLYHSSNCDAHTRRDPKTLIDFHRERIKDAGWEFDFVEPTVNHAFRFPNEALGGLDYGSRFCVSTLTKEILPRLSQPNRFKVLEVGGGTGSFALSFLTQARSMDATLAYHILDLAPALVDSQQLRLANINPPVVHFQQDATNFHLPGFEFDLIIANEVIADFPTAEVKRAAEGTGVQDQRRSWTGEGARYVERYELSTEDAPEWFLVNAGVFEFLERAWQHLAPGGALVLSEYGSERQYPIEAFHLNHAEFSIHFGHVIEAARRIGFRCRLQTLPEFLEIDDRVRFLNGSNEHIQCLNHVFNKYREAIEFALISEHQFTSRFHELVARIDLKGFSFQPLSNNFHYGPNLDDFMVLAMNKP